MGLLHASLRCRLEIGDALPAAACPCSSASSSGRAASSAAAAASASSPKQNGKKGKGGTKITIGLGAGGGDCDTPQPEGTPASLGSAFQSLHIRPLCTQKVCVCACVCACVCVCVNRQGSASWLGTCSGQLWLGLWGPF